MASFRLLGLGLLTGCGTNLIEKAPTYGMDSGLELPGGSSGDDLPDSSDDDEESGPNDSEQNDGDADLGDSDQDADGDEDGFGGEEEEDSPEDSAAPLSFTQVVLAEKRGAAWLKPYDVDGDGFDEYLLTSMTEGIGFSIPPIGPGGAYVMYRAEGVPTGTIGTWELEKAFDYWDGVVWPQQSSVFDLNNDGVNDWIIGCGFLARPVGNIVFMEGSIEDGRLVFGSPEYIDIPDTSRWYHEVIEVDIDGDGDLDFVTTNHNSTVFEEGTSLLEWYENNGVTGEVSLTRHEIGEGGGALLTLHDLDEDGDQDIILPQFFGGASLVWMEQTSTGWVEHVINDDTGRGFGAEIADMNGDGRPDLVYGNHNHQLSSVAEEQTMGVYWWEIPSPSTIRDLADWGASMHVVYEGFTVASDDVAAEGAPGVIHTGDINGDGRMDVSASGDGDEGVYVFVQNADGTFTENVIDTGLRMAGDHHMADLDGDGDMDFIWAVFGNNGVLGPESVVYAYLQD